MKVSKQTSSGWCYGELQARGKARQTGWFPSDHVDLLQKKASVANTTPPSSSGQPSSGQPLSGQQPTGGGASVLGAQRSRSVGSLSNSPTHTHPHTHLYACTPTLTHTHTFTHTHTCTHAHTPSHLPQPLIDILDPTAATVASLSQNLVLALYTYTAASSDELTFHKGSVITVASKKGEWWKGELNDMVGLFPSNYVQPLNENLPTTNATRCEWFPR